jgi:uncharacterized protein (TIGR02453 family)
MSKISIQKETLQFLKDLKKNNNRDWFNAHKEKYIAAHENFIEFIQALIEKIAKFDKSVAGLNAKDCVFRIYRDVRFSKDKSPYKTNLAAAMMGEGKDCRVSGYYISMEPGNTFLATGYHMVEPADLKLIRKEISANGKEFLKIVKSKTFTDNFSLEGEQLSKVPQGFDKEDPMGDYLKFKDMIVKHAMSDKEVIDAKFADNCIGVFKKMQPFNKFVNAAVS